jgi:Poxvirus A22 protein
MIECYVDVGVKNFFYIIINSDIIVDFNVISFDNQIKDKVMLKLSTLVKDITSLGVEIWYIESQLSANIKCTKIETILKTLLFVDKIKFKPVRAATKYKVLAPEMSNQSYTTRKKWVVTKGIEVLKEFSISETLREKFGKLEKLDDFYDCLLMAKVNHGSTCGG